MERVIRRSRTAADVAEFELWDGAYHRAVAAAAHNGLLRGLFDTTNAIRQHIECLDAIRGRDSQRAEALMRTHLETVKSNMFERAKAAVE